MSELLPVLQTLVSDIDAGRPVVLCTVVQTKGSTPQSAGASMLVRADYTTVGTLGGGCVEAEVRRRAQEKSLRGESGLLDFVLDHDYGWDDGLICGGRMFIGVMPLTAGADLSRFREAVLASSRRESASFPLVVDHEGKQLEYRVRLDVPPTLLIAGAGHVGQAVARLAIDLDFHVVVIDDRAEFATRTRFDDRVELIVKNIPDALRDYPIDEHTYVVIVTRGHQNDHQSLDAVIRGPAGYIGLIGSKRKSGMILRDLEKAGVTREQIDRVHTPIGLPIDAVTVPEIAISIAAELVQVRRKLVGSLVQGPFETAASR